MRDELIDRIIDIVLENCKVITSDYNAEIELEDYETCKRDLKKLLKSE